MKRVLLLLTVVFCTLGASHAQNIVIGERAPELKSVTWLASRNPAAADLSYLVFFHSSNKGCTASLDALRDLSNKLGSKLRIIIITQEDSEKSPRFSRPTSPNESVWHSITTKKYSAVSESISCRSAC